MNSTICGKNREPVQFYQILSLKHNKCNTGFTSLINNKCPLVNFESAFVYSVNMNKDRAGSNFTKKQ